MKNFVEMILTCVSWQEAQKIADHLLEKRLVACVEFMEIKSKSWWKGTLEDAKEVKLIMQSLADNFKQIETEVSKLHSYETFVLQQIPLTALSKEAQNWLVSETNLK
jgi:periplasmic divalent cation tolerance protein